MGLFLGLMGQRSNLISNNLYRYYYYFFSIMLIKKANIITNISL